MLNVHYLNTHKTSAADLDWPALLAIEPRLGELYESIKEIRDPGGDCFCAESLWHRRIKIQMSALVGFRAHDPRLRTMDAYDLALEKLYEALPPCRGCACVAA